MRASVGVVRVWVWARARVRSRVDDYRRGLSFEDCVVGVGWGEGEG